MIKTMFFRVFCALFFLILSFQAVSEGQASAPSNQVFSFIKKWGNGDTGFVQKVSVSEAQPAYLGGGHSVCLIPAVQMNTSMNIFGEWQQRLLMPMFTKEGRFKAPETHEEHLSAAILAVLSGQLQNDQAAQEKKNKTKQTKTPTEIIDAGLPAYLKFTPPTEANQFVHVYEPDPGVAHGKSVLIVPGSKKARLTELYRAQVLAQEGYRVVVMDYVAGGEATSTVSNQLSESLDANAINVLLATQWMQEEFGAHDMVIQANSVGSQHTQHAFDPEFLAKVPSMAAHVGRIKLIQSNDFAGPLIPKETTESPLKVLTLTKHVGTQDGFTSKAHVERAVKHYEIASEIIEDREGAHDLCCSEDMPEGASYFLGNAKNYSTLLVSMPMMHKAVQQALVETIAAATGGGAVIADYNALLEPLMRRLGAITIDGNVFSNPALYVHGMSIQAMKSRLDAAFVLKTHYRAMDRDIFVGRFAALFEDGVDALDQARALVTDIGLGPEDSFGGNHHLLTDYILRADWFKAEFKRLSAIKLKTQEEERRDGLRLLLTTLHIPYKAEQDSIHLQKKLAELEKSADVESQLTAWQNLFRTYNDTQPDKGVWIPPMGVMDMLSLLPMGAVFGAASPEEYETHEVTLIAGIRHAFEDDPDGGGAD